MHVPSHLDGASCPVSNHHFVAKEVRDGLGDGPVYLISPPVWPRIPHLVENGWSQEKALWLEKRSYKGPVLIRVKRLDGPTDVRFDFGESGGFTEQGVSEVRIPVNVKSTHDHKLYQEGFWDFPGGVELRHTGCYAFQIDGLNFSYVIVILSYLPTDSRTPTPS